MHGRIIDAQGLPIAHVVLALHNDLTGAAEISSSADNGMFAFQEVSIGKFVLTIKAEGFANQDRRVVLAYGSAVDLGDIRLAILGINQSVTVVSASRVEELQQDSPTRTLVVDKQQIQNTGYERVGDVLSEIPGFVTRSQSYGVAQPGGEQINGVDSRQVLILQDGLPIVGARGILEGVVDLNSQEIGKLDRIEVVEGAASSLYGSDAIGGVVNLITRDPSDPFDLSASLSGGSLGAIDGRLDAGFKWKNLSGFAAIGEHTRDSYTLLSDDISTVGPREERQDFTAKLRYTLLPTLALGVAATGYRAHDLGLAAGVDPFSSQSFELHNRSNDSMQSYAVIGDYTPTQQTALQVRYYDARFDQNSRSNFLDANSLDGPSFDLGNLNERYRRADATIGQQLGSWQFLQGGYEWARDLYRGANRLVGDNAGDEISTNDLWLQDRLQPFSMLTVTVGGRLQHHSLYGNHLVPKVGVVYRLGNHWTLRGSFGAGFRAPDLGELYYHLLHLDYGYQVIGNSSLRPETSQSYSAGTAFNTKHFQLGLNLFRNNLNHLIDTFLACDATSGQDCSGASLNQILQQFGVPSSFQYDDTGASFFTFIYRNVNRAYTQGVNVSGEALVARNVKVVGSYTYLEAIDSLAHTWLPDRSRHQGHVGFEFALPRRGLFVNIRGNFLSGWPTGSPSGNAFGYQTWNLYASKKLGFGVQAFGAIDNLADDTDRKLSAANPTFDRPDYGRTFRIGLRYGLTRHE